MKSGLSWFTALALVAAAILLVPPLFKSVVETQENLMLAILPSAERASLYGERHFNSSNIALYDIERAQILYEKARVLDPRYPYVHHQLARIDFLKGNLHSALYFITKEVELHGDTLPDTHYVRGLILGYMGNYEEAAIEYETYLLYDTTNWAAANDYAWVLLKAARPRAALEVVEKYLQYWKDNPWLLNSAAIAAFELGEEEKAHDYIARARMHVQSVTTREWLVAYPGNDPRSAGDGLTTLRNSIAANMHTIEKGTSEDGVQ